MLGPTGIGVVWGRKELLENLDPVYGGGDMIEEVFYDTATWAPIPHKFEAGTPPYVEAIGLGAAVDYLSNLDMNNVQKHSDDLREYAKNKLENIDGLNIIHTNSKLAGCTFAMSLDGVHATDVSLMLDTFGVAVRAGHHCVQPFHRKLNLDATFRATGYIYNDEEDFDILSNAIEESIKIINLKMSIQEKVERYKKTLALFPNPQEKYQYLIEQAKKSEDFPTELRIDEFKVNGCQSQVWLVPEEKENKLYFKSDSDALIAKGLVTLIASIYSDEAPKDIVNSEIDLMEEFELGVILSPARRNGAFSMLKTIKEFF